MLPRLREPAGWTRRAGRPGSRSRRGRGPADGSDVEVHVVDGMGHAWPGAQAGALSAPDTGVHATELIWEFFAAHPRP